MSGQGKKLPVLVFSEGVGDVFKTLVFQFGSGHIFFLDAFIDFFAVYRNIFRGFDAKLDMTAIEIDDLDDNVVADPYGFT
jgi:hypothetical protein